MPDVAGGSERIYRTDDLGLMRPDGCLEHHGRKDFQVKISGYRIEVSEVEMALLNLVSVKQAAVVAREQHPGDQRLIAYIVPTQGQVATTTELRRFLRASLPAYMIPFAFVLLGSLPMTSNGKLDRRALPMPGQTRPELEASFVPSRTSMDGSLLLAHITETLDQESLFAKRLTLRLSAESPGYR
jgi:acyl-coenzyme A synthetase/AMP-(fatty) acid ligase